MNSINNLVKYNYESESKSPIRVLEYLLLTTEDEFFLMFKLKNELEQKVKSIDFKIELYNKDNYLIEEAKFSLNETHNGYEEFIPERKLKIEQQFDSIKIVILKAVFDKVIYENGEISKIVYTKDDFKSESMALNNGSNNIKYEASDKWTKKTKKLEYKEKKSFYKKEKKNKYSKDIYKINQSKKARVVSIIFMILIIGYFISSLIYFVNYASEFNDGTFTYKIIENNELKITNVSSTRTDLIIPEKVNGYKVSTIDKKAFENNTSLTSIRIDAKNLKIESRAFYGCSRLSSINNADNIYSVGSYAFSKTNLSRIKLGNVKEVYEYAFADTNLTYASMPKALLHMDAFNNVSGLEYLNYDSLETGINVVSLFGTSKYTQLCRIHTNELNIMSTYFDGLTNLSELTFENANVNFPYRAIINLNVNYIKMNIGSKQASNVFNNLSIDTVEFTNNGTYANLLLGSLNCSNVIFNNGTLSSKTLDGYIKAKNIYFRKDVDYSSVYFDTMLNIHSGLYLYFEDTVPAIISNSYRFRCKGNVTPQEMSSKMIIAE